MTSSWSIPAPAGKTGGPGKEDGPAPTGMRPQGLAPRGLILTPQFLWLKQLLGLGCAGQQGEAGQAVGRPANGAARMALAALPRGRGGLLSRRERVRGRRSARSQCHLAASAPTLGGLEGLEGCGGDGGAGAELRGRRPTPPWFLVQGQSQTPTFQDACSPSEPGQCRES